MRKECESRFRELPVIRDIETCRNCRFLFQARWDNNGYLCANTFRSFGHPWCRESRRPVSPEDLARVHIYILDKLACPCEGQKPEGASPPAEKKQDGNTDRNITT